MLGGVSGVFNRLCGKLTRHAHDRQDEHGCEHRRIAAQAPGTLVAPTFARLAIRRGRKAPAERHEGQRRDGDGRCSDAARLLGRCVCIDPCGACSRCRPVPRHASSKPSPSPESSWDYRYSNGATAVSTRIGRFGRKTGRIGRQRQERAIVARTARDNGFVTAVGLAYGGAWSRGAWKLAPSYILATRSEPKKLTAIRMNLTLGPTWRIDPGFRRIAMRRAR